MKTSTASIIIYLIGCIIAFIYFRIQLKKIDTELKYKYIIPCAIIALFSWAAVLAEVIVFEFPKHPKWL